MRRGSGQGAMTPTEGPGEDVRAGVRWGLSPSGSRQPGTGVQVCGPPAPRRAPSSPATAAAFAGEGCEPTPPRLHRPSRCTCWGPDRRRGQEGHLGWHFAHPPRTHLEGTSHRLLSQGMPLEGDTCRWLPQRTWSLELAHTVPVPSVLGGWGHLPEDCRVPIRRTFSRFPWTLACPCGPVLGGTALHWDGGLALAQRSRVPCPAAQPRVQKRPQEDCWSTHILPRKQPRGRGAVGATLAPQGASAPGRGRHEHHTMVLLTVWAGEASKNQGGTSLKVGGSWEVLPGRKTPDSGRKQGALETSGSPPGSETVFLRTPRTLTLQESRMAPVLRKAARKSVSPQASFPLPGRPRRCPRPPPQPAPWRQERQLQAVPRPLRDTSRSPELANSGHKSPANRIMRFNI